MFAFWYSFCIFFWILAVALGIFVGYLEINYFFSNTKALAIGRFWLRVLAVVSTFWTLLLGQADAFFYFGSDLLQAVYSFGFVVPAMVVLLQWTVLESPQNTQSNSSESL